VQPFTNLNGMKSILFLMLSISLLTISCTENTVNIEMQYSPQIIVEGYLRNNQPITIRLSLSKAPDVPFEMFPLVNAKISLFENDIFIDTMMMIDSGVYRINWFPKNKCIYRIEINYKNYPKITAQTFIDDSVKLSVKKVLTQYKGQQSLQFKCQVLDNQQNRFYGIGFYEKTLWKQFCSDPFYTDTFYAVCR